MSHIGFSNTIYSKVLRYAISIRKISLSKVEERGMRCESLIKGRTFKNYFQIYERK